MAGQLGGPGDIDGIGKAARFRSPYGVADDGAGRLFVTDRQSNVVRQVDLSTGAVTTLAGSPGSSGSADGAGSAALFNGPAGIADDGSGNLFVADAGNHTIRKIVIATGTVTTFAGSAAAAQESHDGVGAAARFSSLAGLACDGQGNVFLTDSHTVRVIDIATAMVRTLAGVDGISGKTDGAGSAARFFAPTGVASDHAGHVFVTDTLNQLIRRIDVSTGEVTTVAGSAVDDPSLGIDLPPGAPALGGNADGIGPEARFRYPSSVSADDAGNLFVTDESNDAIRKIVVATREVTTLVGRNKPTSSIDRPIAPATWTMAAGLAWDRSGVLYVAVPFGIRKLALATGELSLFVGSSQPGLGFANGIGDSAVFSNVVAVASDGQGSLFVVDRQTVRKVDVASGTVTTFAGSPSDFPADPTDGIGTAARFMMSQGLAADGSGHLFVSDGDAIRKIDIATGAVTTFAGSARESGTTDGPGPAARFKDPGALAWDGAGSLFVSDTQNFTLRRVDIATGAVTTLAGLAGSPGSRDGVGTDARTAALFVNVTGLAADRAGSLYAADRGNNTIRKVDLTSGRVTTFAGFAITPGSTVDGVGGNARFDGPAGIVCDGKGNLLVAETGGPTVRKIVIATQTVSTVVGSPGQRGVVLGPFPASLASPVALAIGPSGELLIGDAGENVILAARF